MSNSLEKKMFPSVYNKNPCANQEDSGLLTNGDQACSTSKINWPYQRYSVMANDSGNS